MQTYKNLPNPEALPAIIDHKGSRAVGARDLYHHLGLNSSQFTRWAKKNISNNPFVQKDQDWLDIMSNGKPDFLLSLDFAKRLSMMARTERGERIRAYFIECEKMALDGARPRTQIDILRESVKLLHGQEQKLLNIAARIHELEARATTGLGYYSITGYAALKRKSIDIKMAACLGAKANAACRVIGCITGQIPDPRFGRVNTYPEEVLASVFNDFFNEQH